MAEKQPTSVKENGIKDTALYLQVGNPDTALVIFMFQKCNSYDYDLQREEYIRWDLEKLKLRPLLDSLFGKKDDYKEHLTQIESNENRFLQDAHKSITSDAKQYHGISDMMEFAYLVEKRDTSLKDIMMTMLKDSRVDSTEKSTLEKVLNTW